MGSSVSCFLNGAFMNTAVRVCSRVIVMGSLMLFADDALSQMGVRKAAAEEKGFAEETRGTQKKGGEPVTATHATTRYRDSVRYVQGKPPQAVIEALDSSVKEWDFQGKPLKTLVVTIGESHEIPVELDARALEDAGIDLDTPITKKCSGVSLKTALRRTLADLDLAYRIDEGGLVVTIAERAQEQLDVVMYPLPISVSAEDATSLIDAIESTIYPDSWETTGGPGVIRFVSGEMFAVSQTTVVHSDILAFMESFDADLEPEQLRVRAAATRVYPMADIEWLEGEEAEFVEMCNAAVGNDRDDDATVAVMHSSVVVRSKSRPFHVYAAKMIRHFGGGVGGGVQKAELGSFLFGQ